MPAPKGNKFAAKDNPKTKRLHILFKPEAIERLKNIASQENISMAQVIEKSLLVAYPKEFDKLF